MCNRLIFVVCDEILVECVEYLLNHVWEVLVLQCMYLCGYIVRCVGRQYGALCLEECGTLIILFVDEVDCDSALGVTALYYGFVYTVAVHALTAVLWQQGWVDVNDSARVGLDELRGHQQKETCEYYKIDIALLEHVDDAVGLHERRLGNHGIFYAKSLRALNDVCVGVVGDYE